MGCSFFAQNGGNIMDEIKVAVEIADRMISIQECEEGYDYTIYGPDYTEIDGGVYDNPDITIREALKNIIEDLQESHYDTTRDIFYRTPAQGEIMADSIANIKDMLYSGSTDFRDSENGI